MYNAIEQFVMNNLWGLFFLTMVQISGLFFVRWCNKLLDEARQCQEDASQTYDAASSKFQAALNLHSSAINLMGEAKAAEGNQPNLDNGISAVTQQSIN